MLSCSGIKLKLHVGGGCFLVLVCFDGGWDWSLWQWRLGIGLLYLAMTAWDSLTWRWRP